MQTQYTHTHLYILLVHVYVIQPVGCGKMQKYIKYVNVQCRMLQIFYNSRIINNFYP